MNKQQLRVTTVLERMTGMAKEDEEYAEMFAIGLEDMLGNIASNDGFGSEMQCDPRGDGRDDNYSIDYVQGIDG